MSIKTKCLLVGLFLGAGFQSNAQSDSTDRYRPKVAEFSLGSLMDYHTVSSSENLTNTQNEVEADLLLNAKVAVPIILQSDQAAGLQLKYSRHRFMFDDQDFQADNGLYSHLEAHRFTVAGVRGFYQRDLNASDQLKFAAGAEIRSDRITWNRNTSRIFASGIWTRKLNSKTTVGTGFVAGLEMQLFSFYPLLIYERQLAPSWVLDAQLPKSVRVRKKLNASNYLIGATQLRGWRYNLSNSIETVDGDLTLRRADLEISITWERELHDWLWCSVSVGYNKNLRYYLAEPGQRRRNALATIRANDARYAKVGLFLVPPKKFYQ